MSFRASLGKQLPLILIVLIVLLAVGFWYVISHFMGDKPVEQKKIIQQITIMVPPPPPPPEQEPEPEPEVQDEVVEEQIDEAMPDDAMDDAAISELGLDADGGAGSDGFGLIARKGGHGFLGGGSPYAAEVQTVITDVLATNDDLKRLGYVAVLKLWIDQQGNIDHYEIQQREGDPKAKSLLQMVLASVTSFDNPPPLEMPQPIRLRIRSQL